MSDEQFRLRWKGKISGPYPRRQIERKIQEHEIGMFHEINVDDEWITVREFLGSGSAVEGGDPVCSSSDTVYSSEPSSPKPAPPSPWLLASYFFILALVVLAMLGWTSTWVAPSGWAPLLGLGFGLLGAFAALLALFQGEKKHGLTLLLFSILLAFANMMLG